jgi:hypothetical protein
VARLSFHSPRAGAGEVGLGVSQSLNARYPHHAQMLVRARRWGRPASEQTENPPVGFGEVVTGPRSAGASGPWWISMGCIVAITH